MKRAVHCGLFVVLLLSSFWGRELIAGLLLFLVPAAIVLGFLGILYGLGHVVDVFFTWLLRSEIRNVTSTRRTVKKIHEPSAQS